MDALRTYDYLAQSRDRIFDAVRMLSPAQCGQRFPFGVRTIAATLTHTMNSEWYYVERLAGRDVPPYSQWPIQDENPPAFDVVERTWRAQAQRTRAALAAETDWSRTITYTAKRDHDGRRVLVAASAGDFFTQLVLHEVHHRAQVMAMLRLLGPSATPVEDIDFNALMFRRTELD